MTAWPGRIASESERARQPLVFDPEGPRKSGRSRLAHEREMRPLAQRVSVQRWGVSRNRKGRTLLGNTKKSLEKEKKMALTENSHNSLGSMPLIQAQSCHRVHERHFTGGPWPRLQPGSQWNNFWFVSVQPQFSISCSSGRHKTMIRLHYGYTIRPKLACPAPWGPPSHPDWGWLYPF